MLILGKSCENLITRITIPRTQDDRQYATESTSFSFSERLLSQQF